MSCEETEAEREAREQREEQMREALTQMHEEAQGGFHSARAGALQVAQQLDATGGQGPIVPGLQNANQIYNLAQSAQHAADYVDQIDAATADDDDLIGASNNMANMAGTLASGCMSAAGGLMASGNPAGIAAGLALSALGGMLQSLQTAIDAAIAVLEWALSNEPDCDPDAPEPPAPPIAPPGGGEGPEGAGGGDEAPFEWPIKFDPLVMDLDGDGVELTAVGAPEVFWDADGDGVAEMTGWAAPDDGFLVRDLNGNGVVDGQPEMFGRGVQAAHHDLAEHDGNDDGVIDAEDAIWNDLRVWRDLDQDADTDEGELATMQEAGVASVSVVTERGLRFNEGARIAREGLWTREDGEELAAESVFFARDLYRTEAPRPEGFSYADGVFDLPTLRGAGGRLELRAAMSLDESLRGAMEALVDGAADATATDFRANVEALVARWAGVETTEQPDREAHMRAVLEALAGPAAEFIFINRLEDSYEGLIDSYALRIAAQIGRKSALDALGDGSTDAGAALDHPFAMFAALRYDEQTGLLHADFGRVVDQMMRLAPEDASEAEAFFAKTAPFLRAFRTEFFGRATEAYQTALEEKLASRPEAPEIAALAYEYASAQIIVEGGAGDETAEVHRSPAMQEFRRGLALVDMGEGDDVVEHSESDVFAFLATETRTVYRYAAGDGHDVIDVSGDLDGIHEIRLIGIDADETTVVLADDGASPRLVFAQGGSIVVRGLVHDGVDLRVRFDDGAEWIDREVVGVGAGAENNVIEGGLADETFDPGAGDDDVSGGAGGDVYVWRAGEGDDVVREAPEHRDDVDRLEMRGVRLEDLRVAMGEDGDAVLTAEGAEGSVTIEKQFGQSYLLGSGPQPKIEVLRLDDAEIGWEALAALAFRQLATEGDDVIEGTEVANVLFASAGNDLLKGLKGGDRYVVEGEIGITRIEDGGFSADDALELPWAPAAVQVSREGDDAVLDLPGGGRTVLVDQFHRVAADVVETIRFGDGTEWSAADLAARVNAPGADAAAGDETLQVGTGDADGGQGSDLYLWSGETATLTDKGRAARSETDALEISATRDAVRLERTEGDDLKATMVDTGEALTIVDQFRGHGVEIFRFADGDATRAEIESGVMARQEEEDRDAEDPGAMQDDGEKAVDPAPRLGGREDDVLRGRADDDVLKGRRGDDRLVGRAGDDELSGGRGKDALNGGAGDDALKGGRGRDKLKGGGGEDDFLFARGDGRDVIKDFEIGEDRIRITRGSDDFEDLEIVQRKGGAWVDHGGGGDGALLRGVDAAALTEADFVFG